MNIDDLIDKAKEGKITGKEKEYVLKKIEENEDDNLYDYLYIIGRSMFYEYEDLFVKYLTYYERPDIVKLSLQVLCIFWNKVNKYLDYAIKYSNFHDWDDIRETRIIAISSLGKYLSSQKKIDKNYSNVVKKLLSLFNDLNNDDITRKNCYQALALGYGIEQRKIPLRFNLSKDVNPKVLEWAKKITDNVK